MDTVRELRLFSWATLLQVIRFALAGSIGGGVLMGLTYILTEYVHLFYMVSYVIAFLASVFMAYFLNGRFTFKRQGSLSKFGQYLLGSVVAYAFNAGFVYYLTEYLHLWYVLSAALGIWVGFGGNFIWAKLMVWRQQ